MKTTIKNFNVSWKNIKNLCRQTVNMGDSEKEPTSQWKRKLLVCRHSPLRAGTIQWQWKDIPTYVSTHFCRHVHAIPFVGTQREDRVKDSRPRSEKSQCEPVQMQMIASIEELQNIAEKRLCMQADKITREYMEDLKDAIAEYDEDIAWSLAPNGIYKCGCPEGFGNCHYCENILKEMNKEDLFSIEKRLDTYNEYRAKQKVKK